MTVPGPPVERIDLRTLELLEACPAARGSGSRLPDGALRRWQAIRDAAVAWHHAGRPEEGEELAAVRDAAFGGWDAVQRRILDDRFDAFRRLFPADATDVDLDPVSGGVIHAATNRSISVGVQFDVRSPDGWQALRIKTGRSGTSREEAAAFYQPDEERTLVDLRLAADDLVRVEPPADASAIVDDVATRWDAVQARPRGKPSAGLHCYRCDRPALCGHYPVVGDGHVHQRMRTLRVSKTRLADWARCHRAAAWQVLYGIPKDDGDEDELDSPWLLIGNVFHETLAATLFEDDPRSAYEAACRTVSASEASELAWLFDQHDRLWRSHRSLESVSKTEYQFGVTFVVEGAVIDNRDRLTTGAVAVTMVAATDVNGWEREGEVAAVVEHRTGGSGGSHPNEADLYAVSAWHALRKQRSHASSVAVHFHRLRRDPPECERLVLEEADIEAASARLRAVAEELARLHPTDATDPRYRVGPWCGGCQWVHSCLEHR